MVEAAIKATQHYGSDRAYHFLSPIFNHIYRGYKKEFQFFATDRTIAGRSGARGAESIRADLF